MEISLYPVTIESYMGGEKILWDWSVSANEKTLSGMEQSEISAKLYVLWACIRFLFTKIGRQ